MLAYITGAPLAYNEQVFAKAGEFIARLPGTNAQLKIYC